MTDEQRPEDTTTNLPTPPSTESVVPPAYQQPAFQQPAYPAAAPPAYPTGGYQQPGYPQQPAYPQQPGYPVGTQPPPQYQQPAYPQAPPQYQQQPGYPPAPGYPPQAQPPGAWGQAPAPNYWVTAEATQYGKGNSVLAIIAGVPLLLYGLLVTLAGAAILVVRSLLDDAITSAIGDGSLTATDARTLRDVIVGVAVVILIIGILHLLAAIGIWAHKGWGRWLGIIFGVIGTLIGLAALVGVRATPGVTGSRGSDLGSSLLILVPYAFVLIAMIVGGAHFARRRIG
ncbi:MAG: hypothetical protein QOH61_1669 [Chloroflexota bacterium]|jgi:hypothetical protein|nr:hypothetical protein [Chloroflexota bacterium]